MLNEREKTGYEGRDVKCILGVEGSLALELTGENRMLMLILMNPKYIETLQIQVCFLLTDSAICTRNLFYLSIEDRMYC